MKTNKYVWALLAIFTGVGMGNARAATNDVSALLQQGLFEEEANQNLDAAIQAYQAVVAQTDKNRQFAATAIFRLGECYRKEGKTNEAAAQYQRILSEFADQAQLAKLSQQNLAGMGMTPSSATPGRAPPDTTLQTQKQLLEQEIKLLEEQVKSQQQRVNQGVLSTDELAVTQQKLLELKRQLAALEAGQPASTDGFRPDFEGEELVSVKNMIENSPDLINGPGGPLGRAANLGHSRVVEYLLDHGANVNGGTDEEPPLISAAMNDQKTMVELLLDRGADVNAHGKDSPDTALTTAIRDGYLSVVQVLLAHKADVKVRIQNGKTPLHLAVEKGYTDIAGLLITNGADVNAAADYGYTPLFDAARTGNTAVMQLLIDHKAEVDAKDNNGLTPLFFAVQVNQIDAASLLLKNQADVNALATGGGSQPDKGWSPLHVAVARDEVGMAKLLLEHGARMDVRVPVYANQFTHDRGYGFMQLGAMPGAPFRGDENVSPLTMAVMNGRKETVQLLIEHHADVNARASAGDSPLTMAAKMDYPNGSGQLPRDRLGIAELLLDNGADVNLQNDDRESALSLAVKNHLPEMVKLILAHKPQVDILDNNGWTPLQLAVSDQHPEIAGWLLDGRADPNLQYPNGRTWGGRTPLTAAVVMGDKDLVEVLLAHHADPNAPDGSHETPLSWAKGNQRNAQNLQQSQTEADIVELLLKAGANENLYRLSVIHVSRPGNLRTVFTKQPDLPNHFTLLDLVTQFYAPPHQGPSQLPGLPFPDFARVTISRMKKDGSTNVIRVDLESAFEAGDCSKNVTLEWGDIVEIPEADHNVTEDWSGLSDEARTALRKCVAAQVAIMVKGRTNLVTLKPLIYRKQAGVGGIYATTGDESDGNFRRRFGGFTTMNEDPARQASFWLYDVVYGANVILTSSDLSRVKVTRKDAVTRKTVELTFDLEKNDPADALWLRDGDVIEIPEKP